MQEILVKEEAVTEAPKVSRLARLRNRLSLVFGFIAAALFVAPVAANAQTSTTMPDATTTATNIIQSGGAQLANTAVAVIPVVISVLVVFWALKYALSKLGFIGKGKVGVH